MCEEKKFVFILCRSVVADRSAGRELELRFGVKSGGCKVKRI